MIVFGHSAGANIAAHGRLRPPRADGGLSRGHDARRDRRPGHLGRQLGPLRATAPGVDDGFLAADPRVLDALTPWTYLAEHKDLKVVMLVSENPGARLRPPVGDPWAADSWLAARDPSGDLRRQLEANGALADGILDFVEVQQLLFSVLKAQGNPVSLDVMPGSTHDHLSDDGWKVFLAAFPKAAATD